MTSRRDLGSEILSEIQGAEGARAILDGFARMGPGFDSYMLEACFADIYGRAGLTLAQRQLINVAVLTALGGCEPQLAVHIRGALNVGVSATEITETVIHVSLYAGHPRTGNGMRVVEEVFAQRGIIPTTGGDDD